MRVRSHILFHISAQCAFFGAPVRALESYKSEGAQLGYATLYPYAKPRKFNGLRSKCESLPFQYA